VRLALSAARAAPRRGRFARGRHRLSARAGGGQRGAPGGDDEVAGYGLPGLSVAAIARRAELGQAMALVLSSMPLPTDVTEAAARADLAAERDELVATFAGEAVVTAERRRRARRPTPLTSPRCAPCSAAWIPGERRADRRAPGAEHRAPRTVPQGPLAGPAAPRYGRR
jgi:hypothetical protein